MKCKMTLVATDAEVVRVVQAMERAGLAHLKIVLAAIPETPKPDIGDHQNAKSGWPMPAVRHTKVTGYSKAPNGSGPRPVSQTDAGKICLSVFDDMNTAGPADFCRALTREGYAVSSYGAIIGGLVREGVLKRTGHGRYRRPTEMEEIREQADAARQRQDPPA